MPSSSPVFVYSLYAVEALIALTLFGMMLFFERREFNRRSKAESWTRMRLWLLPIAAVTAAVIVLPALAIRGPEALAVFYLGVLSYGPLVWFGTHWLIGSRLVPRLSGAEALFLAFTPIGFGWMMALAGHQGQSMILELANSNKQSEYRRAILSPSPYQLSHARRYATPDGGFTSAFWVSLPPIKVERIDRVIEKHVSQDIGFGDSGICQEPGGIRWVRAEDSPAGQLLVYWRDEKQQLRYAELSTPGQFIPAAFEVQWDGDLNGFKLPEAFSIFQVQTGTMLPERGMVYDNIDSQFFKPGDDYKMNCFTPGWRSRARVDGVALLIQRSYPKPPLKIQAVRPASAIGIK